MDIKIIDFACLGDARGKLVSLEQLKNVPFSFKRVYYMFDTEPQCSRGFHAHKKLTQLAIVLKGSCRMLLNNGNTIKNVILDKPTQGVIIEPMIWHEMHEFSEDCLLMVLADDFYDESDYIRDYKNFMMMVKEAV